MKYDPNDPRNRQPEAGTNEDLNLTNHDASLVNNETSKQPDATTFDDKAATDVVNDAFTQTPSIGSEIYPAYGDAADPTFEML